eukprot:1157491-Pelagomonas_calceolata.AAC.2
MPTSALSLFCFGNDSAGATLVTWLQRAISTGLAQKCSEQQPTHALMPYLMPNLMQSGSLAPPQTSVVWCWEVSRAASRAISST